MKLAVAHCWLMTIFAGILLPLPGSSHSLKSLPIAHFQHLPLLAQAVDYYALAQQARQQEQITSQEVTNFEAIAQQVHRETNRSRLLKLYNLASRSADRVAAGYQRSARLGLSTLPYYRADPYTQTTLDKTYRIQLELVQVFQGYSQLYQQSSSAVRANNLARLNVLGTKFRMLDEREALLLQTSQQITQAYINRSGAANAQSIDNLYNRMGETTAQRGQATKCMVSNLPYGSPGQIASNASAYCNSR
jgi:hypothetical protein